MDSSISIINSSVTELEKDNLNLFEKFTFESVITKLERPIGKGCPVYVMNASTGTIIHRTETDALSKVYIPNLRKYNKYLVIAADLQDIYNSVVFDVTWDFNKNLAYNYSLDYYDVSNLDNIQAFFEYKEYEKATDQNVVVSLSHPYDKDTSSIEWLGTGTTYRDNVKGVQGFRCLNSNIYLPKSVFYQNLPFTFEAYFKLYGTSNTNQNILYQVNGSSGYFSIHVDPNLNLVFRRQSIVSGISDITMTSLSSLKIDGNYHVALSYDGTSFYLFLNGVLQTTLNDSNGLPYVNTPLYVGHSYNGVISHPLITNSCKYTTNFDVLFKAFSYDPVVYNNPADAFANYVRLLIKNNDKTVQKMVDDKARNIRFENNVDENSTREFFNVSTHNPTISNYSNLPLGTQDFCIEVSAKVLSKLSATPMLASNIATNTQWAANNWAITFNSNANPNKFGLTAYNTTHWGTTYPAILKEQFDLAVVREGTKLRFYINGFLDTEYTIAANLNLDNRVSSFFSFGKDIYVNLYDLKFTLGSPRYTANYEPALIDIEDKVLLATQYQYVNLPFKKSLTDSNTPLAITNTNISLSSLHSINGTSSALFDGISSKLSLASWYTGKEKFTVEMAVLPENLATIQTLFSLYSATVEFIKVGIKDNKLGYYNGTAWVDTDYVFTPNTFNHIVIKRDKTQLKILANGGLVSTITLAVDMGMNLTACVGASKGTADFFKGHLNNLYIYKNYIKYADTYEVPVEEQVTDPIELEPVVVVDQYTTAALDFENGLVDKITTTTWNKEGTANVSNANKIFGSNSFETKALGDSLYTNSKIITGGSTPFTVEFYINLNKDQSQLSSNPTSDLPIFTNPFTTHQGLFITSPYRTDGIAPWIFRLISSNGNVHTNTYFNTKNYVSENNKITLSYDGAAIRLFLNDSLIGVYGSLTGIYANSSPIYFYKNLFNSAVTSTKGLVDNVNVFDGVATKVRDYDPNSDFLVSDLDFSGENNSRVFIDNAPSKPTWTLDGVNASTHISIQTNNSVYATGYSYLNKGYNNNATIKSTNVDLNFGKGDWTITFEFIKKTNTLYCNLISVAATNYVTQAEIMNYCALFGTTYTNIPALAGKFSFFNEKFLGDNKDAVIANPYTTTNILISKTTIAINVPYRIDMVFKNGVLSLYVNKVFDNSIPFNMDINLSPFGVGTTLLGVPFSNEAGLYGSINYFKAYKGVAVIPENPVGKIQLDFDNNLIDNYNNSTWTGSGVTFDQINSVKGYSAKFVGNSKLTTNLNDNLNFSKNNFKLSLDFNLTDFVGWNTFISSYAKDIGGSSISYNNNSNITRVRLDFNNYLDFPSYHVLNSYYNICQARVGDSLLYKINDVVQSCFNTSLPLNHNSNGKTTISGVDYNYNESIKGYIDNFKSQKDSVENTVIDSAAVHLPLETNSTNIGFTPLTVNAVGNPIYTTIENKKCVKFDSGKYLTINSHNIFNLGSSSDFYIEFDFYPIKSTNGLISNTSAWVSGTIYLIHNVDYIMLQSWKNNVVTNITTINKVILNSWNNVKLYKKGLIVYISLNDIVIQSAFNADIDFCFSGSNLSIGTYGTDSNLSENASNAYMSNFKMFVGTSEIPETYHDKKVLSLDFKPTRKSYLFKDNNNKCIIHPVKITQRDYQNSKYCCTFNGIDQYLQLGKNDLLNFGLDAFVIAFKVGINNASATDNKDDVLLYNNIPWATGSVGFSRYLQTNKLTMGLYGTSGFSSSNSFINGVNDIIIVRDGTTLTMFLNDVPTVFTNFTHSVNLNAGNNTLIGRAWEGATANATHFNGQIYSIKVLRNTTDITLLEDSTGEVIVDPRPPIDTTKRPYTVRFNFENDLKDAISGSALTMSTGVATYGTAVTKEVSSLASFDFGNSSTIRDMQLPSDLKPKFNLTGDFTLGFDLNVRSSPTGTKHILTANPYGSYTRDTAIRLYENSQDPTKFMIRLENNIDSSTYEYVQIIHPLLSFNTNINVKFIRKGNAIRAYINNYFVTEVAWNTVLNFNRYAGPLFGNYTVGNNYSPDMLLDTFFICDNYVETFHAVEYTA